MRIKILVLISFLFYPVISDAGFISVSRIHDLLGTKGAIVSVESGVDASCIAASSYIMRQIDVANLYLNGFSTTNYSSGAENVIVGDLKAETEIDEKVEQFPSWSFEVTGVNSFNFHMSAAGLFGIDWGDGSPVEVLDRTGNTTDTNYSHTFIDSANVHTIKITGKVTEYSTIYTVPVISFYYSTNKTALTAISSGLGALFHTLSDGTNPRFRTLFFNCTNLTSVPSDLFAGISGSPSSHMFNATFQGCSNLEMIPFGFSFGVSGAPAEGMFLLTFQGCSSLDGNIPSMLLGTFSGQVQTNMFDSTFRDCSSLDAIGQDNGSIWDISGLLSNSDARYVFRDIFLGCSQLTAIPVDLFSGLLNNNVSPSYGMFSGAFEGCSSLTEIPNGFSFNISGALQRALFQNTFAGCSELTGLIPASLFGGSFVSNVVAKYVFRQTFYGCVKLLGFAYNFSFNISGGQPAENMFESTFYNCNKLDGNIPSDIFGKLTGSTQSSMFRQTFYGCSELDTIAQDNGSGAIWDLSEVTFDNISAYLIFYAMFEGCSSIISASPNISATDTRKLYECFTSSSHAFLGCTQMTDYAAAVAAGWAA